MALDTAAILTQIDDVLARCGASVENPRTPTHPNPRGYAGTPATKGSAAEMVASCLALIDRIARGTSYQQSAMEMSNGGKSATSAVVNNLLGIVVALRRDVEAGYTTSLVELVHQDLFADFLDMASELQRNGFKDAAAVIAGSTLEEHLRKLAAKAQLPTTNANGEALKASRLNDDLRAAQVYNPIQQRAVQSWLDLRNAAAHGNYGDYDHQQVAALIQGVTDFMARHSA
jgi:phage-related protein